MEDKEMKYGLTLHYKDGDVCIPKWVEHISFHVTRNPRSYYQFKIFGKWIQIAFPVIQFYPPHITLIK